MPSPIIGHWIPAKAGGMINPRVNTIKGAAKAAGLEDKVVGALSGHSMRVGAAQDLMRDGAGLPPIMRAGGWKSLNVLGRYVEHAEIAAFSHLRK